jgi:hypothetical protein
VKASGWRRRLGTRHSAQNTGTVAGVSAFTVRIKRWQDEPEEAAREDHLFVLRVWREAAASSPSWRATIEHIPTGARLSSADLTEIDDFIRLRLSDERDLAEVSERRA